MDLSDAGLLEEFKAHQTKGTDKLVLHDDDDHE
jgi:hypothetical protein